MSATAEILLEALLNSPSERIIFADSSGTITRCSAGFAEMLGYKPLELLSRSIRTVYVGSPFDPSRSQLQDVSYRARDGMTFAAQVSGGPLNDGPNIIGHFERVTSGASPLDTNEFVNSNMLGLLYWDMSGRIVEANDYLLTLVGYTREEMRAGKIRWDLMTPLEYMDVERRAHQELAERGVCTPFEKEYIRKDGTRVPILIGGALNKTKQGGTCFVVEIKKAAETESLKLAENLFRTVFEQSPMSIAIYDLEGVGVMANRAWERLWATTRDRVKEFNLRRSKEMVAIGIDGYIEKAYGGEPTLVPPVQVKWPPGPDARLSWISGYIFPVKDLFGNVREVAFLTQDVTNQIANEKRLEEIARENERLYNDATAALSARDEFLSIASHELKTPLTSLHMAVQILKNTLGTSELQVTEQQIAELLSTCERQSRRLATLIHELLDLTRVRAGRLELKLERFDLCELARDIVSRMAETAGGIEISLTAPEPVAGNWDRSRLEQVMTNLLSNAIKYGRALPIGVSVLVDGGRVVLKVSDQGIGIPENEREKIFERFEQSSVGRNIGGLGLGLYIVRKIVEAHSGAVSVQSVLGKGTTFTVELPV